MLELVSLIIFIYMEEISPELNNQIGNDQTLHEDLVSQPTKDKTLITTIFTTIIFLLFAALMYLGYLSYQKESNIDVKVPKNVQAENSTNLEQIKISDLDTELKRPEKKYLRDWSLYTSEKLGISFENPGNFFLETTFEDFYPDQSHISLFELKDFDEITESTSLGRGGSNNYISISAFENLEDLSLIEWAKKNSGQSNYREDQKMMILDGNDAIRYVWEGMGQGETVITKNKNKQIILISYTKNVNLEDYFELLLKSIKFN